MATVKVEEARRIAHEDLALIVWFSRKLTEDEVRGFNNWVKQWPGANTPA